MRVQTNAAAAGLIEELGEEKRLYNNKKNENKE